MTPPLCPSSGTPVPIGVVALALSGSATAQCEFCRAWVPFTLDWRYVAHPYVEPKREEA